MSVLVWHFVGGYGCWCFRVSVGLAADRPDGIEGLGLLGASFPLGALILIIACYEESQTLATLLSSQVSQLKSFRPCLPAHIPTINWSARQRGHEGLNPSPLSMYPGVCHRIVHYSLHCRTQHHSAHAYPHSNTRIIIATVPPVAKNKVAAYHI